MLHNKLKSEPKSLNSKNPLDPFKQFSKYINFENEDIKKRISNEFNLVTGTDLTTHYGLNGIVSNEKLTQLLSKELSMKLKKEEFHGLTIEDFTDHILTISNACNSKEENKRNLILSYSLRTRQLHELQKKLNYSYCATNCHYMPIGCCSTHCYETGVIPEISLLQKVEAIYNGLKPESKKKDKKFCLYHSEDEGCKILLFKSPPAFRFFCKPLKLSLKETYGMQSRKFYEALAEMKSPFLEEKPEYVIESMDKAIVAGKQLLL